MSQVIAPHIEIAPGVAGGKPRIAGHRITVQNVAVWHDRLGITADAIADEYGLTLAEIHAALSYYFDHRDDIDQSIREDEAFVADFFASKPSRLRAKLSELGPSHADSSE